MSILPMQWLENILNRAPLPDMSNVARFRANDNTPATGTPIRAVLTDCDGVIGNIDKVLGDAYQELHRKNPVALNANDALKYASLAETSGHHDTGITSINETQKTELFDRGRDIYAETKMQELPDAEPLLNALQQRNIPWAVVSNNVLTQPHWQQMGLAARFPNTPVIDQAQKPETAGLQRALDALQQPVGRDVIMIDDNWKGLTAAARLGVTPVYFGKNAHIVLPMVAKECQNLGIPAPQIVIARDHAELQQVLTHGIPSQSATLPAQSLLA